MNVRELVTILKFKTDSASIKSAEASVNRIKQTMSRIKPVTLKMNTGNVSNQISSVQTKLNSLRNTKAINVKVNTGNASKQIATLQNKLNRVAQPKKLQIGVNTSQLNQATQSLNRFSQAQTRASQSHYRGKAQGLAQGGQQSGQQGGGIGASLGMLKGAFVALGGMALVNEIKETADAMMSMSSRIKLVTKDDAERLQVEQRLYQMSMKNRSSLEDLGDLYYKTASSAKQFGASQEDVLKLTDIVSKSLVVGGADTAQQKSTILQLSQALSSGVLQGDELRSLRENAPRLMQEIAKNMGTTMAGLKEMGAKGELTTEKLMQAILQSGGAIEGEFARMTPTIGQAITVLGNRWQKFILDIQNNTGVFGHIAGFILDAVDLVGEGFDFLQEQFKSIEPEFNGFMESLKGLWAELKPLFESLGTIFKNIIVPALRVFWKVALAVFGAVADALKPIANLLGRIADLIATASGGMSGLIKKAESGAIEKYKSLKIEQNNNVVVDSGKEAGDYVAESTPRLADIID